MTENEAIELLRSMQNPKQDYADVVCAPAFCTGFRFVYPEPEDYAIEEAIKALKEVQQYRKIGTVEQVKNQKENLNVAYQIISDYEQYGTIEDFKKAQRYMRLVNAHGTIGRVIDSCAEYESIGTVEECREAVEKQKPKKPHRNYKKFSGLWCKCGWYLGQKQCLDIKYCPNCGQAIDENLEGMEDE